MTSTRKNAISPSRQENYPEWYQQVIKAADLAENSPVRGCMVIKPYGYAIWELMRGVLDTMIKETGHENACFPLLIPLSFLEQEAEHVKGFAKECAVVTHHRLETNEQGKLVPASPLEEPFVIRPTSETVIGYHYAKWVQSYRDLPILINQWANVMRWEMRPRLFLRTSEFFWQEGHTVHESKAQAVEETLKMLDVYEDFVQNYLAIPVLKGVKTKDERFPGAVDTYTIETMTQDGKALQSGTSHYLGQNFAKASQIKFLNRKGEVEYAYTTSWGATTRLIGGLIMTHSDDDGLILPPRVAPKQVIIIPVFKEDTKEKVLAYCQKLAGEIANEDYHGVKIRVQLDDRDMRGGEKTWAAVKRGIPIRIEVGPRDIEADSLMVSFRNQDAKEKASIPRRDFVDRLSQYLEEIQTNLFEKALAFRKKRSAKIDSLAEFEKFFASDGGFAYCHWNEAAIDHEILKKLKVTPRCIPLTSPDIELDDLGKCIFTGLESKRRVVFATSY